MEGKQPPRTHLVPAKSSCLKGIDMVLEILFPVCSKSWSPKQGVTGLGPLQMVSGSVK